MQRKGYCHGMYEDAPEIRLGILLPESVGDEDETNYSPEGHEEAWGTRGRRVAGGERRAKLGQDILHAAACAVGREVAVVMAGVVAGIESPSSADGENGVVGTGSFAIESLELTFCVKAALGTGPAVEAFLTASGEATVEVKLTLSPRSMAEEN